MREKAHALEAPTGQTHEASSPTPLRFLSTLERLLAIPATSVRDALVQACDAVVAAIPTQKVDAFLYEAATTSLVARGVSTTPLGQRQKELGLDRLPLANGGRTVEVFQTGLTYRTGHADQDPGELRGITEGLGIRSIIVAPLQIEGDCLGVLQIDAQQTEQYTADDQRFVEAVARWVAMVASRAQLAERLAQESAAQARRHAAEEVVTILAHDLRNHMTPLKGQLDLLHRRARREERLLDVQGTARALQGLQRLDGLITDLLDVGRLDQGLFALQIQPADLVALVQQTTEVLQGAAGTSVVVRAPAEVVAEVDPQRLRQALENVVSNALRHAPHGTAVTVEVSTEERPGGHWALLSVHDAGPGIPPALLPRIFDRFTAGPGSRGLGLGLYLTRAILEAHGGTATVQSAPGAGTAINLALPLTP